MKSRILFLMISAMYLCSSASASMMEDVISISHDWAKANYDTSKDQQEKAFENLVQKARSINEKYADAAEPKIWLAIALSTDAGVNGGLSALGKVKEARVLLEQAETINPDVLQGSVYTSLGSLYYQVPGWPIGFGNDDKAEEYLKKALSVNPNGIDPNYFYGDFMLEEGEAEKAIQYLEKALQAPPRPDRPLADKGRKNEIAVKLVQAKEMLN